MRHIFNTTFIVEENTEQEWLAFMRTEYIPAIAAMPTVGDRLFTKVSIDQPEGKTYSLQLIFPTAEALGHFEQHHLPEITERLIARFRNRYLCFSSTLTEI